MALEKKACERMKNHFYKIEVQWKWHSFFSVYLFQYLICNDTAAFNVGCAPESKLCNSIRKSWEKTKKNIKLAISFTYALNTS